MYEDTQSGPRSRSVSGHEAMNVYGRRANTRCATDPEEIRPSYRFEVSPAEQNRSVKKSFRGALLE